MRLAKALVVDPVEKLVSNLVSQNPCIPRTCSLLVPLFHLAVDLLKSNFDFKMYNLLKISRGKADQDVNGFYDCVPGII